MTGRELELLLLLACWEKKTTMQEIAENLKMSRRWLSEKTKMVEIDENLVKQLSSIGIDPNINPFIEIKGLKEQLSSAKKELKHIRVLNEQLISENNVLKRVIYKFIDKADKLVTPKVKKLVFGE